MTATGSRRPTATYRTQAGTLIAAIRLNPGDRLGRATYAVLVDGAEVARFTGSHGRYHFTGSHPDGYITTGGIDAGMLYSIATAATGRDL